MKLNSFRKIGCVLVEIVIVAAINGLLAAVAIPNFVHARDTSPSIASINNKRQVDCAKQVWALELKPFVGKTPGCPDLQPNLGQCSRTTQAQHPSYPNNAF